MSKRYMPDDATGDNPNKENAKVQADILTKIGYIGVGLFFEWIYRLTSGDRDKHQKLIEYLIGGKIHASLSQISSGRSFGLQNAFRDGNTI